MLDLDNISHNCCPWPKSVSWLWPKVISPRARLQYTYIENLNPGHDSLLQNWIWIIFHTLIVHDPRVCHDLHLHCKVISPMLRSQCTHTQNPCLGHNSSLPSLICIIFNAVVVVSWPWAKVISPRSRSQCTHTHTCPGHNSSLPCWILIIDLTHNRIMTLTQGNIAEVKVTVYTWQKFVSRLLPFTGNLDGDDSSHNCCKWPNNLAGIVVAGGICPVRTCLVIISVACVLNLVLRQIKLQIQKFFSWLGDKFDRSMTLIVTTTITIYGNTACHLFS